MPTKAKKPQETTDVDDALGEVNDTEVTVTFRGEEFVIPRHVFVSPAFNLALAAGKLNELVYSVLGRVGPDAPRRFLATCTDEDTMFSVAVEFIDALSLVAGQGNS